MKKTIILSAVIIASLTSCEKWELLDKDKKDVPCQIVSSESIPSAVSSAFQTKYQGATVETWFNKDNTGYCALFTLNGVKTLSQFDNNGNFVKEETEVEQEGEYEDNENDTGCECEIENED